MCFMTTTKMLIHVANTALATTSRGRSTLFPANQNHVYIHVPQNRPATVELINIEVHDDFAIGPKFTSVVCAMMGRLLECFNSRRRTGGAQRRPSKSGQRLRERTSQRMRSE